MNRAEVTDSRYYVGYYVGFNFTNTFPCPQSPPAFPWAGSWLVAPGPAGLLCFTAEVEAD